MSESSRDPAALDGDRWVAALGTLAVPLWLGGSRVDDPPTTSDLTGVMLELSSISTVALEPDPQDRLRWLVGEILKAANVTLVPSVAGMKRPDRRYQVSAMGLGRLEQPPPTRPWARSQTPGDKSFAYWRVPSLLPVIALELARAIEPEVHYRCSRCGRLARVSGRRPRADRGWYGDHAYCRHVDRAKVVRRAGARRDANRRAAKAGTDSP